MQRFRTLGLAILAIFAIGAITAASATAEELRVLPEASPSNPVTFTVKSGAGVFNSGTLLEIKCEEDNGTGAFTSKRLGTFRVVFGRDCKNGLTQGLCRGLNSLPGQIVVEGEFHLRRLLNNEPKHIVVLFLVKHVHFTCGGVLVLVLGCVIGLLLPEPNLLSTTALVHILVSGGRQAITEADNDAETGMETCGELKQSIEEGSESNGTEETEEELTNEEQLGTRLTFLVMA